MCITCLLGFSNFFFCLRLSSSKWKCFVSFCWLFCSSGKSVPSERVIAAAAQRCTIFCFNFLKSEATYGSCIRWTTFLFVLLLISCNETSSANNSWQQFFLLLLLLALLCLLSVSHISTGHLTILSPVFVTHRRNDTLDDVVSLTHRMHISEKCLEKHMLFARENVSTYPDVYITFPECTFTGIFSLSLSLPILSSSHFSVSFLVSSHSFRNLFSIERIISDFNYIFPSYSSSNAHKIPLAPV